MDNETFIAELDKMDFVHLRNFESIHRDEIQLLPFNNEIKNCNDAVLTELIEQSPMDKALFCLGYDMNWYVQFKDKNSDMALKLANKWAGIAHQEMLGGNKLEMVRALDISLFFDPTNTGRSCWLVQQLANENAGEAFKREARFAYFYLIKKFNHDHKKLAGLTAQMWRRFKRLGVKVEPDNLLFKGDSGKSVQVTASLESGNQPTDVDDESKLTVIQRMDKKLLLENDVAAETSQPEQKPVETGHVRSRLNLLKTPKNIRREVGKPWESSDEAMRVCICDREQFEKRCNDETDSANKKQMETFTNLAKGKRLSFITESVFAEIKLIGVEQPNFHKATEIILDTLYAQHLSGMPACLPPLLMNGSAGVGKTRYVRRMAKALGLPYCDVPLAGNSDAFKITGLSRYWGNAGPGIIAKTFAHSEIANPIFLLDEIDKSHKSENGDPLSRILLLLEKETSTTFKDDFFDVPIDVSYASYLATCNKIDDLPAPLLSRFICVNIQPLDYNGRCTFVNTVYKELCEQEKYGAFFTEILSQDTLSTLAEFEEMSGREIKRVILQGMQRACRAIIFGSKPDKSLVLKVSDLQLPEKKQAGRKIGFMA